MKKKIISTFFLLVLNFNLYADEDNKSIRIGLLAPLTGTYSELGNSLLFSLQLALEEINDENVIIIPRDSGFNEKEKLFSEVEIVEKELTKTKAEILDEMLPEAFAVVKETARRFYENESIKVKVPAGVDNGTVIRLRGRGGPGDAGAPDGDLLVQVAVESHKFFKRSNSDLILEVPLLFTEAALGSSIKIPTLEKNISLKIPPNTQTGKVFRIKGKGASIVRDRRRGDILCRVVVETPSNLDKNQIQLLQELNKSLDQSKNYPGTDTFLKAISKIKDYSKSDL